MNKMKGFALAFTIAGLLAAGQAQAAEFDFTAGEGFVNGNALTNHAGWEHLNGNNTVAARNIVNTSAENVLLSSSAWCESVYTDESFPLAAAGDAVMVQLQFRFTTTGAAGSECSMISAQLAATTGTHTSNPRLAVRRDAANGLQLYFREGDGPATQNWSPLASETLAGISGSGTSDLLELTLVLGKNHDTGVENWSLDATLRNVTSNTVLTSISTDSYYCQADIESAGAAWGAVNSSWIKVDDGVSSCTLEKMTIEATTILPTSAGTVIISGATGNGDFQANDTPGAIQTIEETPNW